MSDIYTALSLARNYIGGYSGTPTTLAKPAAFEILNDVDETWRISSLVAGYRHVWKIRSRTTDIELLFGTAAEITALDLGDTGSGTRGFLSPAGRLFEAFARPHETFAYKLAPGVS
ncbi:hypothetical protein K1W69_07210 [Hoeflea sp. WL0058]|uniref:Uncharacterized protein n=1 Tax=Flavimaribacter sediminis TaxID=2865987 RepID=A0AAE2ZLU1_9HYPH|nr:hypothetical protein [Flavimaribacter sediminis]MBW8636972.1 hypothetical protein [Flavimaribacter sediminis]